MKRNVYRSEQKVRKQSDLAGKIITAGKVAAGVGSVAKTVGTATSLVTTITKLVKGGATAAKIASAIAGILVNHPEWYKSDFNTILSTGMNYALAKNFIPRLQTSSPSESLVVSSAEVVSYDAALTDYVESDDQRMFLSAVQKIYTIMNPRGRNPEYSIEDLANYLFEVREVVAAISHLAKLFQYSFYLDSSDPNLSQAMFLSSRFTTPAENLANIRERFVLLMSDVATMLPMPFDIFARTAWVFGNVFIDEDEAKPTIIHVNPTAIEDISGMTLELSAATTFEQAFANIRTKVTTLTTRYYNSTLATNLEDAFGMNMNEQLLISWLAKVAPDIPEPFYVVDPHYLQQLENANMLEVQLPAPFNGEVPPVIFQEIERFSAHGHAYGNTVYAEDTGGVQLKEHIKRVAHTYFDNAPINGYMTKDTVDQDLVNVSITRLHTPYSVTDTESGVTIVPASVGTEQIIRARVISNTATQSSAGKAQNMRAFIVRGASINGNITGQADNQFYDYGIIATSMIRNVSNAPRTVAIINNPFTNYNGLLLDQFDYALSARPSNTNIATLNAIAVTGLLAVKEFGPDTKDFKKEVKDNSHKGKKDS